jgi:hypothetical protein
MLLPSSKRVTPQRPLFFDYCIAKNQNKPGKKTKLWKCQQPSHFHNGLWLPFVSFWKKEVLDQVAWRYSWFIEGANVPFFSCGSNQHCHLTVNSWTKEKSARKSMGQPVPTLLPQLFYFRFCFVFEPGASFHTYWGSSAFQMNWPPIRFGLYHNVCKTVWLS